tara:strand:- start:22 stop:402 length:381 start_codon:yes stop_codon:yes gene_type:complete
MKNLMLKAYVTVASFAVTNVAHAQEDLASRITDEGGWLDQLGAIGMLVLAAAFLAGVGCVSYGIWYYVKKSDNPQEPDAGAKALKFIVGGAALTIVPLVIAVMTMTLGGDSNASGTVNTQLDQFQN